jgi:hypothetical protein
MRSVLTLGALSVFACSNSASNGSVGTGGSSAVVDSHCPADAGALDYRSPVGGKFYGWMDGNIPAGSAFAHMERTEAASSAIGLFQVVINNGSTGDSTGSSVALTVAAGVGSPTPGTYGSHDATSCGSLSLCLHDVCFVTKAPLSCVLGSQMGVGSWTLNLTSVTPYTGDAGTPGATYYVVHGSFEATIVSDQTDAGLGLEHSQLELCF